MEKSWDMKEVGGGPMTINVTRDHVKLFLLSHILTDNDMSIMLTHSHIEDLLILITLPI